MSCSCRLSSCLSISERIFSKAYSRIAGEMWPLPFDTASVGLKAAFVVPDAVHSLPVTGEESVCVGSFFKCPSLPQVDANHSLQVLHTNLASGGTLPSEGRNFADL